MPIINQIVTGSGGGGVDEFANYVDLLNMINGTSILESSELNQACDDISQFLYGTNNI